MNWKKIEEVYYFNEVYILWKHKKGYFILLGQEETPDQNDEQGYGYYSREGLFQNKFAYQGIGALSWKPVIDNGR